MLNASVKKENNNVQDARNERVEGGGGTAVNKKTAKSKETIRKKFVCCLGHGTFPKTLTGHVVSH